MRRLTIKPDYLWAALLFLVTLWLYLPTSQFEFTNFDDPQYVLDNPWVQQGLTWSGLKWAFFSSAAGNWHPVTWLSHMLDCELFGLDAGAHHFTSNLIHAVNGVLLFFTLRILTGHFWRCLIVAALFALHPMRVESVAWISERKDVLSAAFGFISMICYCRYVQTSSGDPKTGGRFYLLSAVSFGAAVFSKAMLVTWPVVFLLVDFWPLKRIDFPKADNYQAWGARLRFLVMEKLPFFALSLFASWMIYNAQKASGAVASLTDVSMANRIGNAIVGYSRYLGKLLWPTDLTVFYPHPQNWPLSVILVSLFFLILIFVAAVRNFQRAPHVFVGVSWFLGMLFPVIGLVQVGGQSMADRFTYLPQVGLLLAVAWSDFTWIINSHKAARFLLVAGLGGMMVWHGLLTRQRLPVWHDTKALFEDALAKDGDIPLARLHLAAALMDEGKPREAQPHLEKLLALRPQLFNAHFFAAKVCFTLGQYQKALYHAATASSLQPNTPPVLLLLANIQMQSGDLKGAENYLLLLKERYPFDLTILLSFIELQIQQGRYPEAASLCEAILKSQPGQLETLASLALIRARTGDSATATAMLQAIKRLTSVTRDTQVTAAKAWQTLRRPDEARRCLRQALMLSPEDFEAQKMLKGLSGERARE